MITYTITAASDNDGVKYTTVEFDYNGPRTVEVAHFRPSSAQDIEVGIINRINSEVQSIDAAARTASIDVELNTTKTAAVLTASDEPNQYDGMSDEELRVRLAVLSAEYDSIQSAIATNQAALTVNSAEYDAIIEQLLKRG